MRFKIPSNALRLVREHREWQRQPQRANYKCTDLPGAYNIRGNINTNVQFLYSLHLSTIDYREPTLRYSLITLSSRDYIKI